MLLSTQAKHNQRHQGTTSHAYGVKYFDVPESTLLYTELPRFRESFFILSTSFDMPIYVPVLITIRITFYEFHATSVRPEMVVAVHSPQL